LGEYGVFLKPGERLEEGKELALRVRDEMTLEFREVKAVVARSPDLLPGADKLWIYALEGHGKLLEPEPWAIKFVAVEEEAAEVPVQRRPRRKTLTDLIRERQEEG